jgi:hypothetical protein
LSEHATSASHTFGGGGFSLLLFPGDLASAEAAGASRFPGDLLLVRVSIVIFLPIHFFRN